MTTMSSTVPAGDRPTMPEALLRSPEVERWWGSVQPIVARLRAVPEQAATMAIAVRTQITQIAMDNRLSTTGKRDAETAARNQGLQQLDALAQRAKDDVATLQRAIDRALATTPTDPQAQLLRELQLQRAWQRALRLLDAMPDSGAVMRQVDELIRQAADAGDRALLQALEEELPSYLNARNVFLPDVLDRITDAQAPHLPPVARAALQVARQARVGWPRVWAAIEMARSNVQGKASLMVLPGWAPNEQLNITQ
jgi:AraC-like DNA-binding protein